MNVAVFGNGSMGARHSRNAQDLGHEVTIHDPLRGFGVDNEAAELETMRKAHAIIIATPATTHARLLWNALWLGARPVLIEKPLAVNAAQAQALAATFKLQSERVMVGYNLRFHPHVGAMYLAQREGAIGAVVGASFHVLCDGTTWPGASYADALLECSHEIDLALHLLGPAHVADAMQSHDGREWRLVLQHDAGPMSNVHMSTAARDYSRGAVIVGARGELVWTWNAPESWSALSVCGERERLTVDADLTYRVELAAFLGRAALPDATAGSMFVGVADMDAGLRVLRLCDAARAMAASSETSIKPATYSSLQ